MFSLVRYDNGECAIILSKRVSIVQGQNCIVKHTGGGKYNADLVDSSDSKDYLVEIKSTFEKQESHGGDGKTPSQSSSNGGRWYFTTPVIRPMTGVGFSTPTNPKSPRITNLEFSSILSSSTHSSNNNTSLETSAAPSGYTDQLESFGDNWPNVSDRERFQNKQATYDKSCGSISYEINMDHEFPRNEVDGSTSDTGNNEVVQDNDDRITSDGESDSCDQPNFQIPNINEKIGEHSSIPPNCSSDCTESNVTGCNVTDENDPSFNPSLHIHSGTLETSSIRENSLILEEISLTDNRPLDTRQLEVPASKQKKSKQHFCVFCHTLQTKMPRHFMLKHKKEKQVKKVMHLPAKHGRKVKVFENLRKKGDFLHNTNPDLNTGIMIVSRRRQAKSKNSAEDYVCCKICKGFFARTTIRFHYAKCDKSHQKGVRNILSSGRRLTGYIHPCAGDTLRRIVFPVLRDDDVSRTIKYDELLIKFGNKQCDKYTLTHQHDMIRAQLRLLGRFKLQMIELTKETCSINEFKEIYHPRHFDKIIEALRVVANWDSNIMWFRTPAVAQNLTTLIKKCAFKLRSECVKNQDNETKKCIKDFLYLWDEEVPILINKKAVEDQISQKLKKKVTLPSKNDIKLLYEYLRGECINCLQILNDGFNLHAWILLTECTLIFIQIFNRRRAGEIERLTVTNYQNKEVLDGSIDAEIYKKLSNSTREFAKQFVRLVLRGKRGRTVSVLLNPLGVQCIETILQYRKAAGVRSDNEYIFSVPTTNSLSKKYLRACPLMRRFANDCGALIPSSLRGTTLRKHIATYTAMLNIEENQVDRLANFMGHHKDIHKNIYRVPISVAEITDVSRLLTAAIGANDGDDDHDDDDDDKDEDEECSDSSDEDENRLDSVRVRRINPDNQSNHTFEDGSSSNEDIMPESENATNSKRRSTSPFGKTKRTTWTDKEKKVITKTLGDLSKLNKLPSLQACRDIIDEHSSLRNRTPQQLKTWIDNQRRAKSRQQSYACSKYGRS